MPKRIWTILIAFLFVVSLAAVADAQRRTNGHRKGPVDHPSTPNLGNSGQDENPGNGNNGNGGNPGNTPPGPTHDNTPPADEDVCDVVKGGTPGLYGLCIAFCEAHDCEITVTDDGELDFSQCKKNDGKILGKYRARMREGDPDMPCLPATHANEDPESACPCWSVDQLLAFPYAPSSAASWVECASFEEWDYGAGCNVSTTVISESVELDGGGYAYIDFGIFGGEDCGNEANFCFGAFDCPMGDCPDWMPVYDQAVENLDSDAVLNCQAQLQEVQERLYCLEP